MDPHGIDPKDEERHRPGEDRFWNESYYFDFHDPEGEFGGYVRVGLYPNLGVTWYWACVVGRNRPLATLIDHTASVPVTPGLDVTGATFASTHSCAVPLEDFRVGVEGRAAVVPEPADLYSSSYAAAQTDFALDLRFETVGHHGYHYGKPSRYEIPCDVTGRIQVGNDSFDFSGHGQRDHSWGVRDWWGGAWCWNAGRLDDGTRFHSVAPRTLAGDRLPFARGYLIPPGGALTPIETSHAEESLAANGLPEAAAIKVGPLAFDVTPKFHSPVLLVDPDGRQSRFPRCLAEFCDDTGRRGFGWIEWNQPQEPI
jgi:hypothetical protein